ncbi:hypothetical protein [Streptomyces sp. 147326]|uniref:hypothetical protein n=1 Tax=Streptomyces sp. 147326 TaxID=3074379 RepID=UPI003857E06E
MAAVLLLGGCHHDTAPRAVVPLAGAGFPPDARTAEAQLGGPAVAWGRNWETYKRENFGRYWSDETDAVGGRNGCDTRDDVGSRTADKWQPPRQEYRCEYARRYTGIKARYRLSVTPPEKLALQRMPAACPQ